MPLGDTDTHRRMTDHALEAIEEKIITLIEETEDNKDKAFLLILMKINDSITSNTTNTNKIANKLKEMATAFELHVKTEEAILNRGRGWRDILVWLLGIVQAFGIYSIVTLNSELADLHKEQAAQKIEITRHDAYERGFPPLEGVQQNGSTNSTKR